MTIGEALRHGIETVGRRDAGLLLSFVTGTNELFLQTEKEINPEKYFSYIKRLQAGEPLQYIIGQWEFMGLTFITDKRALIPRPETELLVEKVLEFLKNKKNAHVSDVCTGSGCIAISIARLAECETEIVAVDISDDALSLAKENAKKLNAANLIFIKSCLFENICGKFDVIVSNPPYVLSEEIPKLLPNVRDYEPRLALDGGADGLDFYRRIIPQSKKHLKPGGALFLEIGPVSVINLMKEAGFKNIVLTRDYAGIERIVKGEKHV
ncbi:MAG: peptide chain release factor N(5)-glutamine methyltransferase [Clostridiales bacterium]|jgi:release factor glutamine methyltransferase|nr:peptide chain release factor N(5)-glutamine methyltransferase [Clostridiales bacterium]